MQRAGPGLWRSLAAFQVWGANTNVGKTVASTILCKVLGDAPRLRSRPPGGDAKASGVYYLKPVSTGPVEHVDSRHVSSFLDGVSTDTLFQFSRPVSPHIAARLDGNVPRDGEIQAATHAALRARALPAGLGTAVVETAGGVLSPAPSGSSQADLYRPLRLPALLVGDYHLGGIATTAGAYESLRMRGYDVWLHLVFQEPEFMNVEYLTSFFEERGVRTLALPKPPKIEHDAARDQENMWNYYSEVTNLDSVHEEIHHLLDRHEQRVSDLDNMSSEAADVIWYPFTQHKSLDPAGISVIDSAYQDTFDMLSPEKSATETALQPTFDASASWWTQGLGHGNPKLALAAAYAAGRYGHVMFAGCIHQPALELARELLRRHANPRLARVFFSDNGSTGVEVAVKMALRAARKTQCWAEDRKIDVIGLKDSYHGDTIGAMDCAEPSAYNKQESWYTGRGFWFDYPKVKMTRGKWVVDMPQDMEAGLSEEHGSLSEIFDRTQDSASSKLYGQYTKYIENALQKQSGRSFGALIMEPVILGAGGMIFADPLFQRALIDTVRKVLPHVPVIFDEVFTGIYRLGRFNCNKLVGAAPDIVVNAKLLTGGLVPLCTTSASQEMFEAFIGDKTDCLLHGHSYTAHPVGCNVALEALDTYQNLEQSGHWATQFGRSWAAVNTEHEDIVWSVWDPVFVEKLSFTDEVEGVVALGTVLAVTLKDSTGGGYSSSAAADLQKRLMVEKDGGFPIHSRVLGNVIYFITSLTVEPQDVDQIQSRIVTEISGKV